MNFEIFKAIGNLSLKAKVREEQEYKEFLAFYKELVENMPTELTILFGNLGGIETSKAGHKPSVYGIELTATDYIWWKNKIENEGCRFVHGIPHVKSLMLERFAKNAESHRLSPEERKELIAMLEKTQ